MFLFFCLFVCRSWGLCFLGTGGQSLLSSSWWTIGASFCMCAQRHPAAPPSLCTPFDVGRALTRMGSLRCDAAAGNGRIVTISPIVAEEGERNNFNVVVIADKGIRMFATIPFVSCVFFCCFCWIP